MTEIFTNISDEVKNTAEMIWKIAEQQDRPIKAGEFIDTSIKFCEHSFSEEEMEFVHFYIKMQMEKMKNENTDSGR